MSIKLVDNWLIKLKPEFEKAYMNELRAFLKREYENNHIVYPSNADIFRAFEYSTFDNTKVVILGQDPYHGEGQAHGLSFSVPEGTKVPPSLKNIFKEISDDLKINPINSGNLDRWARQGVLLLNAVLTVRKDEPGSHRNKGWEIFTDKVIETLSTEKMNLVFILWGNYAKDKIKLIDTKKHLILTASHPSPLSAYNGFFGCKHFSKANQYLKSHNIQEIDWA